MSLYTALTVLTAILAGAGLVLIMAGFTRRRERPSLLRDVLGDDSELSLRDLAAAGEIAKRSVRRAQSNVQQNKTIMADCLMIGRAPQDHALIKLASTVGGGLGMAIVAPVAGLLFGWGTNPLIIVVAAVPGVLLGWVLPDSILHTEAAKERQFFQQVAESWLELVAQLVTAGSDTFAALINATMYSEQPAFVLIREELRAAALSRRPPWAALRKLSEERGLRFLDPFAAALELAGTTGAGAREAILAQVQAARDKALREADAAAASAGEKAGAPLALVGGAFMIIMGYPPMANILIGGSETLTGL